MFWVLIKSAWKNLEYASVKVFIHLNRKESSEGQSLKKCPTLGFQTTYSIFPKIFPVTDVIYEMPLYALFSTSRLTFNIRESSAIGVIDHVRS